MNQKPSKPTDSGTWWKYVLLIGGLIGIVLFIMDFNVRMTELNRLKADQEEVAQKLKSRQETKAALEAQIAYATSEAAVERWAYGDGHMVRPGDIPAIPISEAAATSVPTPTAIVIPTKTTNIEKWFSLFWGP